MRSINLYKLFIFTMFLFTMNCWEIGNTQTEDKLKQQNRLLQSIVAVQANQPAQSTSIFFDLDGNWTNGSGTATTATAIAYFSVSSDKNGLWLVHEPGTAFPYRSCGEIVDFDNSQKWLISRNPPNALIDSSKCFLSDALNSNKYYKTIWFQDSSNSNKFWSCQLTPGVDTVEAAKAVQDTTVRTNPSASGCGGFAWSWLIRK